MARGPSLKHVGYVSWTGLDELMQSLSTLAPDLAAEANSILYGELQRAKAEIAAAYPVKTGNLRAGLAIRPADGPYTGGARLVQTAFHGHLYEYGTKFRETLGKGKYEAGLNRGQMLSHHTFYPIAEAHQRTAITAVIARLYAHGAASVTGDIETAAARR